MTLMPDAHRPTDDNDPDPDPRVDYVFATPEVNELHRQIKTDQSADQQLLEQVNQAAHAAHKAAQQRDELIRAAIAAGADLDHLAAATGLTTEQLHRINLNG